MYRSPKPGYYILLSSFGGPWRSLWRICSRGQSLQLPPKRWGIKSSSHQVTRLALPMAINQGQGIAVNQFVDVIGGKEAVREPWLDGADLVQTLELVACQRKLQAA